MVETENLLIGAVAVVGGLVALGRLGGNETEIANPTSDSPTSGTGDPSGAGDQGFPDPDATSGVSGFLDTNYGGASGTVNPTTTNLRNPYLAELYDTDTGE